MAVTGAYHPNMLVLYTPLNGKNDKKSLGVVGVSSNIWLYFP
jgi:hypothetical protein